MLRTSFAAALTPGWARTAAFSAAFALASLACANRTDAPSSGAAAARISARKDSAVRDLVRSEALRARAELHAKRVAIVVLDPRRGSILASYDDAPGAPIEPASTMKSLTIALALDAGVVTPEQPIDCGNGSRLYGEESLRDAVPHGSLPVRDVLIVSSNVGTSRVFDALGPALFEKGLERLHLTPPPELPGGGLPATLAAIGFRFPVTPEALARAYAVFANDGIYAEAKPGSTTNARAVSAKTARLMLDLLEEAVSGEHAPGRAAKLAGTRVAGKTGTFGTSEVFANFVGTFPVERPRYVVLVSVLVPDPKASGAAVAAPLFARVAGRLLAHE